MKTGSSLLALNPVSVSDSGFFYFDPQYTLRSENRCTNFQILPRLSKKVVIPHLVQDLQPLISTGDAGSVSGMSE